MRIAHVVRQYRPNIGGFEEVVARLAQEQLKQGHHPRVVTLDRLFSHPDALLPQRETLEGIEVLRLPYRGSSRYPIASGAWSAVAGADLIHVHAIDFFFDFFAVHQIWSRRPLVATTHGGFFHTAKQAFLKKLWFNTITRASCLAYDAIIACSVSDYDMFQPIANRLIMIENGVDIDKFADQSSRSPRKNAIVIGRFATNKRLDRVLDAMAALLRSDPQWRLVIAGSPSDWNIERLNQEIAARAIQNSVEILLRPSNEALSEAIAQASFFMSASEHEGFGLALIEALSAGLQPVVEANAAFRIFAKTTPEILLTDYSDPQKTAQSLLQAYERIIRDGPACRERAMAAASPYAWEGVAERIEGVYRKVMNAPPYAGRPK